MSASLVAPIDPPSCPICTAEYNDTPPGLLPKLLPCFHTICRDCLAKLVHSTSSVDSKKCPCCRSSLSGVMSADTQPTNLGMLEAAQAFQQQRRSFAAMCSASSIPECGMCKNTATHRITSCIDGVQEWRCDSHVSIVSGGSGGNENNSNNNNNNNVVESVSDLIIIYCFFILCSRNDAWQVCRPWPQAQDVL